mmetsp:Transcript_64939/g.157010  ORF Transcript_64939/g.157010 Transcript_64939/m.157010 type:complete len:220 (+) Transcript_64939:221-880(+)
MMPSACTRSPASHSSRPGNSHRPDTGLRTVCPMHWQPPSPSGSNVRPHTSAQIISTSSNSRPSRQKLLNASKQLPAASVRRPGAHSHPPSGMATCPTPHSSTHMARPSSNTRPESQEVGRAEKQPPASSARSPGAHSHPPSGVATWPSPHSSTHMDRSSSNTRPASQKVGRTEKQLPSASSACPSSQPGITHWNSSWSNTVSPSQNTGATGTHTDEATR